MVRLELTPEAAEILHAALESYLSDLRMEIADTDSKDFREDLKRKKVVLRGIAERVREASSLETA